jgi:hypothetical protein
MAGVSDELWSDAECHSERALSASPFDQAQVRDAEPHECRSASRNHHSDTEKSGGSEQAPGRADPSDGIYEHRHNRTRGMRDWNCSVDP